MSETTEHRPAGRAADGSSLARVPAARSAHKAELHGFEVHVHCVRQQAPPGSDAIACKIVVDSDEPDRRLELLHQNVSRFGTVFNTVAPGTALNGVLRRKTEAR